MKNSIKILNSIHFENYKWTNSLLKLDLEPHLTKIKQKDLIVKTYLTQHKNTIYYNTGDFNTKKPIKPKIKNLVLDSLYLSPIKKIYNKPESWVFYYLQSNYLNVFTNTNNKNITIQHLNQHEFKTPLILPNNTNLTQNLEFLQYCFLFNPKSFFFFNKSVLGNLYLLKHNLHNWYKTITLKQNMLTTKIRYNKNKRVLSKHSKILQKHLLTQNFNKLRIRNNSVYKLLNTINPIYTSYQPKLSVICINKNKNLFFFTAHYNFLYLKNYNF